MLFALVMPESHPPIILWIGVTPTSLSGDNSIIVTSKCLELLVETVSEISMWRSASKSSPAQLVPAPHSSDHSQNCQMFFQ